jgi:putative copper resistance protein D
VLAHPVTVMLLFAGSLVVFYYSRLFPLALTTHVGHELMHVHFLVAGYLMAWLMLGVDPGPRRPQPLVRLIILFATMGFHAFFGISLIQGNGLLAPAYFGALGRPWGLDPLLDQQFGGGLAWGIGEFPTLVMALILAVQWTRDDARETRRSDRAADRDGDAELVAYNAMLTRIAQDDARREQRELTMPPSVPRDSDGG